MGSSDWIDSLVGSKNTATSTEDDWIGGLIPQKAKAEVKKPKEKGPPPPMLTSKKFAIPFPFAPGIYTDYKEPSGEWEPIDKPVDNTVYMSQAPKPKPRVSFGHAEGISQGHTKPSFLQRILGFFGVDKETFNTASEEAKAAAAIQLQAKERGMSTQDYMVSPNLIEDANIAISEFINNASFGLVPAVRETLTGETDLEPGSFGGYVASAGGSLAGLIVSPFKAANVILKPLKPFLKGSSQMANVYSRIAKESLRDAIHLGLGMGLASGGEALKQSNFTDSASVIYQASKSGALTGAIFGSARGLFPADGIQRLSRLATGLVSLNAYRAMETGGSPFTDRPKEEVIFDTMLDTYFLWRGLPKAEFGNLEKDVAVVNKKVDEFMAKKNLAESIPQEELNKAANIKLEAERKKLSDEIDALSKRVYTSLDSEAKGKARLEKLNKIKEQDAAGRFATAEELEEAKKSRKKVQEVRKEKTIEEIQAPVRELEKKIEARRARPQPKELLQVEIPPVMKVAEVPSKMNETDWAAQLAPDIKKEAQRRADEKTGEILSDARKKIVETDEEAQVLIDLQKSEEIEKAFGKPIEEIPDADIENYLLGKMKVPDLLPEEKSREIDDEEIAKFYGKKYEELTDEEIDAFFDKLIEEPAPKPKTEPVDTQTGSKQIEQVTGETSIFRTDVETTKGQTLAFSQSRSVANSMDELLNQSMVNAQKGPDTTVWKLVNDVNRWLNGEDVDIDSVRNFLSDIAVNAPKFERYFGSKSELNEWSELASDAAEWARNSQRATKPKGGTSLYSGLDPFEAARVVGNWYSMLAKVAREKLPRIATAEQIKATLRKLVTQDEWNTSQLDTLLENGKRYTKEEVMEQIDRQMPEFKDVLLSSSDTHTESGYQFEEAVRQYEYRTGRSVYAEGQEPMDMATGFTVDYVNSPEYIRALSGGQTKFSSYIEPGGSNYKELFVTAPNAKKKLSRETFDKERTHLDQDTRDQLWQRFQEGKMVPSETMPWQDGHPDYSDIENPIVRLRMNDRVDSEGKKVLFVEELQPPSKGEFEKMPPEFQKRWREIGMKRALKYAIDNGYDKVAWTTGEMQAKRYSLDKTINKISWEYYSNSNEYVLGIYTEHGATTYMKRPEDLPAFLGNDIAKQIIGKDEGELLDLSIVGGGEGLRKLYDQDLPNVVKKLGGKVDESKLDFSSGLTKHVYEGPNRTRQDLRELLRSHELDARTEDALRVVIADMSVMTFEEAMNKDASIALANAVGGTMTKVPDIKSVQSTSVSSFLPRVSEGFTMYGGLDPGLFSKLFGAKKKIEEGKGSGDEIVDSAKGFSNYMKKARGLKEFKPLEALKRSREEFNRAVIDKSGNLRGWLLKNLGQEGYAILQKAILSRGASTVSTKMLQQMRKEVYSGLSANEKQVLDNLILAVRMTDIGKYKKHYHFPKEIDPVKSKIYTSLFRYIEGLSPEQAKRLVEFDAEGNLVGGRVKAYYDWMKKPLDDMLKSGLITQKEYEDLKNHNYRRVELVHIYDKEHPDIKVRGRSVYDSGVESLSLGRVTDIYEPSSEVMALEVFNRAYGRILNNEANAALLKLARDNPDNPFVRVREKDGPKIPPEWKRFYVYENGQRITMRLAPEIAGEWISNSTETSYRASQLIRYISGAPILRTFATGINWGFAAANLPRDMMHVWFAARTFEDGQWKSVYSTFMPTFLVQYGRDVAAVAKDVVGRKGEAKDLLMEGGGFEFLTHQGRLLQRGRHLESGVDKFFNVMGYLGETSELLGRTALRHRVIRNAAAKKGISYEEAYKDPDIRREATFAARDYLDFGQGGWASKTLDQVIPYLNAGIQGSRGLFRAFKPGSGTAAVSMYKLSQFAALVAGLTIAKWKMTPETMQNLQGNIDEDNNLVIPYGDAYSFIDSHGNKVYPYHKIPLDPGQKFFKKFFEAATNKMMGKPVDAVSVAKSLLQLSPVSDASGLLPPTLSAFIGYVTNKDFWLNEDIWKQSKVFPITTTDKSGKWIGSSQERTARTPEVYKDIGDITKLSPERFKYAIEELITSGTEFSYLLGQAYEATLGGMDKVDRERTWTEAIARTPGSKRAVGITNPYSKYAGAIEKYGTQAELERVIQNNEIDPLVEDYLYGKGGTTRADVMSAIRKNKDIKVRERLLSDFQFQIKTKKLSNKSFWLGLKRLPLNARAQAYVDRLTASSPEERQQLYREVRDVRAAGGVISEDFMKEVQRVRRQKLNSK